MDTRVKTEVTEETKEGLFGDLPLKKWPIHHALIKGTKDVPTPAIYLAGPIKGLTDEEAFGWRKVCQRKTPIFIEAICPRRELYDYGLDVAGDKEDIMRSSAIVANFIDAKEVSIGTCIEIGWADLLNIPIFVAMKPWDIHYHRWIMQLAKQVYDDLELAYDAAVRYVASQDWKKVTQQFPYRP